MGLNLKIENETQLPDGGALTYSIVGNRGADIGRDAHLDWTLPDPSRHVSGKHCEVRYQDGGYVLYDVSRNGTYLNGSDRRMQSPYRLRSGDRLLIGHYIVGVEVKDEGGAPFSAMPAALSEMEDPWAGAVDAAPPADPRDLRPAAQMVPVRPDFLEWAVDVPNAPGSGFVARPSAGLASDAGPQPAPMNWDAGPMPVAPPPEPPPPVPTPRRSLWIGSGPEGPWRDTPRDAEPLPPPLHPPIQAPADQAPPPRPAPRPDASDIVGRFARGAGLPPDAMARRDAGDMAEWLGRLMLLVTENLKQLIDARSQAKRIWRSSNQTMIAALDNNPLKFSPTAADALKIMVGPPTRSYLDAEQALQQSFEDLKAHQIKTFAAMQRALNMLLDDMDPKAIEASVGTDRGLTGLLGSRGARLWAAYEARWQAKTRRNDKGLQDLFMQYFAECYDEAARPTTDRTGGGSR